MERPGSAYFVSMHELNMKYSDTEPTSVAQIQSCVFTFVLQLLKGLLGHGVM